jgi:uncharacterized protein (DUF2236 family)
MRRLLPAEPFVTRGMAWRVHRERVLLAGWARAILLQIAHPKVARGVAEHSGFTTEPWGRLRRLHRTLSAMLALTFGSEEEAAAATARINAIHDRVHGRLDAAAGGMAAGASYSAHDPELLTWVHATCFTSMIVTARDCWNSALKVRGSDNSASREDWPIVMAYFTSPTPATIA